MNCLLELARARIGWYNIIEIVFKWVHIFTRHGAWYTALGKTRSGTGRPEWTTEGDRSILSSLRCISWSGAGLWFFALRSAALICTGAPRITGVILIRRRVRCMYTIVTQTLLEGEFPSIQTWNQPTQGLFLFIVNDSESYIFSWASIRQAKKLRFNIYQGNNWVRQ